MNGIMMSKMTEVGRLEQIAQAMLRNERQEGVAMRSAYMGEDLVKSCVAMLRRKVEQDRPARKVEGDTRLGREARGSCGQQRHAEVVCASR